MTWTEGLKLTRRIEMAHGAVFVLIVALSISFVIQRNIKKFRGFAETSYKRAMWYQDVELNEREKARIDQWVEENGLNKFGESRDKVYVSFPLVDEVTGEVIDRYRYILSKHPHRPWHE